MCARAVRSTTASASKAGALSASSRAAGCQKRKLEPERACTASATFSSAVKRGSTCVIWNERASPRCARAGIGQMRDVAAVEDDAAGVGGERAGDLVDEGGLAGAVGADDGVGLAGEDVEVDAVGDLERAERLAEVLQAQHGRAHRRLQRRRHGDAALGQTAPDAPERHFTLQRSAARSSCQQPGRSSRRRSASAGAGSVLGEAVSRGQQLRRRHLAPPPGLDRPGDAALGEQHHQHQQRPQDRLPMLGEARQRLLQHQEGGRADDGAVAACRCRPAAPS